MDRSRYNKTSKRRPRKLKSKGQKLLRNTTNIEMKINKLSNNGDGVGLAVLQKAEQKEMRNVYVANTLPGEVVRVRPRTKIGKSLEADLLELIKPSADRKLPECKSFPICGGCQLQHLSHSAYVEWKKRSILDLFIKANIRILNFSGFFTSIHQKRRRASFKFKRTIHKSFIGFYANKSHQIIELDNCAVLSADLLVIKDILLEGLDKIMPFGITIVIHVNQYDSGSDVLIMPEEKLPNIIEAELASWASNTIIQRVSLAYIGDDRACLLYQHSAPNLVWGNISISPPPGSFLQPTLFGESELQNQVFKAHKDAECCLDLFAGCGTLSAKLLSKKVNITAIDNHKECLESYQAGYRNVAQDNLLKIEIRNLFKAPVKSDFLDDFDGIILDPPRNGAFAQIKQISMTKCPLVTYVSCNPYSFIKDAKILIDSGYQLSSLSILDQFTWTTHSELIGNFYRK